MGGSRDEVILSEGGRHDSRARTVKKCRVFRLGWLVFQNLKEVADKQVGMD